MSVTRRGFLGSAIAASVATGLNPKDLNAQDKKEDKKQDKKEDAPHPAGSFGSGKRPIVICAHNGINYLDDAYAFLKSGGDTLDAALRVVKGPEDDPNDDSVGLGGLPNEEGVVELDACCMHGPTRRAGSVGVVRNIKNVSLVSKAVFEHTGHVMLVGEGAERFAVAVGFPRENLLTERSRKIWLLWKEYHSSDNWWGPGLADPQWQPPSLQTTPPVPPPQAELWKGLEKRLERKNQAPRRARRPARHRTRIPHGRRPPRAVSAYRNHPLLRAQ